MQYWALVGLIFTCIFDPADKIFHLKMPLFCLCWLITLFNIARKKQNIAPPAGLLTYVFLIILIPLTSILLYFLFNGSEPFDGFLYFRSYLFITILLVLYISGLDMMNAMCGLLTILSTAIICIFVITSAFPIVETVLYVYGLEYGNLALSNRTYGNFSFTAIFYRTSAIIAISIAYYTYKALNEADQKRKWILYAAINIVAMFMAGTRNNIVMAFVIPLFTIYWYSKRKLMILGLITAFVSVVVFSNMDVVSHMFDPAEASNRVKIAYIDDYLNALSNTWQLLFGQGLGAFQYWEILGRDSSVTELTFLEIFRNYGLMGGIIMLSMILYPITNIFYKRNKDTHYASIGYLCYLMMSFTNPFLFSSSGMLVLSVVLSSTLFRRSKIGESAIAPVQCGASA